MLPSNSLLLCTLLVLFCTGLVSAQGQSPQGSDSVAIDTVAFDSVAIDSASDDIVVSDSPFGDTNGVYQSDEGDTLPTRAPFDSSVVTVHRPDTNWREGFSGDEFVYEHAENPETFLERLRAWLRDLFGDSIGSEETDNLLEIIAYVLGGATIAFVAYHLIQGGVKGALVSDGKSIEGLMREEEDIHEMSFDRMIDEALRQEDHRRAARLLYLKTLKELSDRGMIAWRRDKTNHDYLHEVGSGPLGLRFARLTLLFEYVWYGDFPIDRAFFDEVRPSFDSFNRELAERG